MPIQRKRQVYNDGVCTIWQVGNVSDPGDLPKEGLTAKIRLRYAMRTVGYKRYWTAAQEQTNISLVIRTPYTPAVSTQDIVTLAGINEQYKIVQLQRPTDAAAPSLDLSLERLENKYEVSI